MLENVTSVRVFGCILQAADNANDVFLFSIENKKYTSPVVQLRATFVVRRV